MIDEVREKKWSKRRCNFWFNVKNDIFTRGTYFHEFRVPGPFRFIFFQISKSFKIVMLRLVVDGHLLMLS